MPSTVLFCMALVPVWATGTADSVVSCAVVHEGLCNVHLKVTHKLPSAYSGYGHVVP